MSKLAFSEYYLISSACFKMPPDFEIKLLNDSTGFHRQDHGGTRPGGDAVESFRRGGCAPRSNPLPFYIPIHFWEKWCPFRIPSTDKWYRFHIPSLELCIPLNCYKCNVYNVLINRNKLFHSHKINPSLALLGRFIPRWQIALPFHIYFNWWSPFIYMKHKKGPPFGRSLPVKSTIWGVPSPGVLSKTGSAFKH